MNFLNLDNYILFWVCIIGLCMGSFFNVVILRSLSGESIVFPPSKCPTCGEKLKPWHNIPVLSYIFLGGKCGFCKEKISLQYPIVELLTMALFLTTYIKFGLTLHSLFIIILLSSFLIMTFTDLKERLVDCSIAIFLTILGIVYNSYANGLSGLNEAFLGAIYAIAILELYAILGKIFCGTRSMGEGDTYVAATLGACFGWHNLINLLIYSIIAALIFIIPMFLYQQYKNGNKLVCILMVLFLTLAIAGKIYTGNLIILSLVTIIGILLSIKILKSIKNGNSITCPPFVPAFSLAILYYLFLM